MKRIKAMFSGKKSRSAASPPGIGDRLDDSKPAPVVGQSIADHVAPAAPVEESGGPTYESWLRERQRALGFSGDSYESLEFTDISDVQRALFKNSGFSGC